jgi:beta-lactamase class A
LDDDKPLISINPDAVFSSASVIKASILLTLLEQSRLGALSLEQTVNVEHITGDSIVFDSGPRKAGLRELAVWMTILSDNTSTNALIDILGFDTVNAYMRDIGLKHTVLRRKMLDFAARRAGADNLTNAVDMFMLFKYLFGGDKAGHSEAIAILRRQRSKKGLTRYIWEDAVIAHKTGGLDYLSHDAGVFSFGDKHVFAGVFLWNTERIEGDPRLIGSAGRLVFDYFRKGSYD